MCLPSGIHLRTNLQTGMPLSLWQSLHGEDHEPLISRRANHFYHTMDLQLRGRVHFPHTDVGGALGGHEDAPGTSQCRDSQSTTVHSARYLGVNNLPDLSNTPVIPGRLALSKMTSNSMLPATLRMCMEEELQ
ncbi:hypothetical protein M8818_002239 [Zalaria obscura]|uniref:Uncharacterized protein n=1 Tax=Zalaria obscura TaxID=2024903 RepID=A0ACC3SIN8_9PEZI